jgi:hypothetical protein
MAKQVFKSVLGNKVDPDIKEHANDQTNYGGTNRKLPPGIEGVARLVECRFGVHERGTNKGKVYFYAVGDIISPKKFTYQGEVIPLTGMQTKLILPWNYARGSQGSVSKSKAIVMNELRKLAGREATANCQTGEDLEILAKTIEEEHPYFRFSTSLGTQQIDPNTGKPRINPNTGQPYEPIVWENWHGTKGLEDFTEDMEAFVDDHTGLDDDGDLPGSDGDSVTTGLISDDDESF